jgi:hypothetical protein
MPSRAARYRRNRRGACLHLPRFDVTITFERPDTEEWRGVHSARRAGRNGETRIRTGDTTIFRGGATDPTRHAGLSKKTRVYWRFAPPSAAAVGGAAGRDTGGYPKMPGVWADEWGPSAQTKTIPDFPDVGA